MEAMQGSGAGVGRLEHKPKRPADSAENGSRGRRAARRVDGVVTSVAPGGLTCRLRRACKDARPPPRVSSAG